MRRIPDVGAIALAAALLAACSSGSSSTADAAGQHLSSRGPITYVQGKDKSNLIRPIIAKWNKQHPNEKVTLKEQTARADQQHDDLVQHFLGQDSGYDVVSVDVVSTAEFAAKGWLQPLTGNLAPNTSQLLPATVNSGTFNGTLYAAPQTTDGGLLYYRKDLVSNPPTTWAHMMSDCKIATAHNMDCYAGQFSRYEGLTVNVTEAINTFGGSIVAEDGRTPTVDSPQAKAGLQALVTAYRDGNIPAQALSYQEEQGRTAFESGKLLFLRNWPYVYNLAKTDASSKVKNTFGIAPLPGLNGPGASSLDGYNAAISVYSDHKATAADFLRFLESQEIQKFLVTHGSPAPVLSSLYTDPSLVKKFPYLPVLKKSLNNAVPRPITPFYPAVTTAIQDNAYAAFKGESVATAIKNMSAAIEAAGSGS